jgi:hypothetical protein
LAKRLNFTRNFQPARLWMGSRAGLRLSVRYDSPAKKDGPTQVVTSRRPTDPKFLYRMLHGYLPVTLVTLHLVAVTGNLDLSWVGT